MSDSRLPDAIAQHPGCGACGCETRDDGYSFICDDCGLKFDHDDLSASFLDPEAEPCGKPCENWYHGPGRIKRVLEFDCNPCRLPAGHVSLCSMGCRQRTAEK